MKLTKSKIAFIIIIMVIIASSITSNYINNIIFREFAPEFVVKAIRLDEKPTKFISFKVIDSYGIHTIFDSTTDVPISYPVYTEIRQIINLYETYNVEYEENYYRLQFEFPDDSQDPPRISISIIIFSYAISIISLISTILIIIILIVNAFRIIRRAGLL